MVPCSRLDVKLTLALAWALGIAFPAKGSATEPWQPAGPHRYQALTVPARGRIGFQSMPPEATRLTFTNVVPESRYWTNQLLLDGGGVTAADVDGDGRVDVFFTGQAGLSSLWRNLGDWHFTNVTSEAFGTNPVLRDLDGLGCAFADLNGDGWPDLVVNSHGQGTHIFFNDGRGRFIRHPITLNPGRAGYTLAIADVDGDGWLDVYICNYRVRALMDMPNARATLRTLDGRQEVATVDGRPTTEPDLTNRFVVNARGGVEEVGEPDMLYRNLGGTNFLEIPWTGGAFLDEEGRPLAKPLFDWGLSAMFRDLNGDGRPELYVCNDFQSPDRLWLNQSTPGRIQFRLAPRNTLRHTSFFSMGVDFADVNRDGIDDFVVLDMMSRDHRQRFTQLTPPPPDNLDPRLPETVVQYPVNTLQLGMGDGTFAEVAAFAGLQATEWSWTPVFLDVDLDGWEDLLVSNGQWRASRDLDVIQDLQRLRRQRRLTDSQIFSARKAFPRFEPAKLAFQNDRHGRFREMGAAWGFDAASVAHGMCLADLDGDGDLDVILNRLNGPALLYRNETTAPRLLVRLAGGDPNGAGIGSRITVRPHGPATLPVQTQQVIAGGRYLSGDAPDRVFAVGDATLLDIDVRWPDGRRSAVTNAVANRRYELRPEPASPGAPPPLPDLPWFEDRSAALGHAHKSRPEDEFARQPLLPRSLASEGPGVAWSTSDATGGDTLIVGAGNRGEMALISFEESGKPGRRTTVPTANAQATILPWGGRLLVAGSTLPGADPAGLSLTTWPPGGPTWPVDDASWGALAAADVDGDGQLELFCGGRAIPGHWPSPAVSRLFKEKGGTFTEVQRFPELGLVQGAVFTDLDQDGRPDLALALEWGPIVLFRNRDRQLTRWDAPVEIDGGMRLLSSLPGWWTSIQAGDFDGDGLPDLVVGNWGENDFRALYGARLAVFHGDLLSTGNDDILEAYAPESAAVKPRLGPADYLPMHSLAMLGQFAPTLRDRFPTHRAFAEAHVADLLGSPTAAQSVEAVYFSSVLLLNRGDHFLLRRLPDQAQWSPAWGLVVADWDGDGREDLFLSQNFFGENFRLPRNDAGLGLVLHGDGQGGFTPLSPLESGVRIEGEGRGAATADFDRDGRPDLAVGQFNGGTKLYRNARGRPGLRVRLQGDEGNPLAAGASLRLVQGGKPGPLREIRLGGGHWSCDAAVTVLARPVDGPAALEVRWPGGRRTTTDIPSGTREVTVKSDGAAK